MAVGFIPILLVTELRLIFKDMSSQGVGPLLANAFAALSFKSWMFNFIQSPLWMLGGGFNLLMSASGQIKMSCGVYLFFSHSTKYCNFSPPLY